MNRIPKAKGKYFIPHQNNMKITQKESNNEHLVPKITQRNLKFSSNRNFGKDISNVKNNQNKHNNSKVDDKKSNNIYIKKHSSASQVSQKTQKIKISINDKQLLKENKSGGMIKKNDININKNNYKILNAKKEKEKEKEKEKINLIVNSKLHSSISFGVNNNNGTRPYSGTSNSVRIPNQKNSKKPKNGSNTKININKINNNEVIVSGNNNKNELTTSNLNLM